MKYFSLLISLFFLISCGTETVNDSSDSSETVENQIPVDTFKVLSDNIAQHSENATHWAKRGDYFFDKGKLSDARKDYEQAIVLDSLNAKYRTKFGNILIGYLDLEGAKFNFEKALQSDSLLAEAYIGLGRIYTLIDNPGLATAYLNKAQKINPYLADAYFLEGLIYRDDFYKTNRKESWERAKSSFQTATEQNPRYYDAYINLGIMNDAEDLDLALDYFNSAIFIAPESSEAWYNKGMYFQKRGNIEDANDCYRKIIKFDSTHLDALFNQGYFHLTAKPANFDSAIYFYDRMVAVDSLSYRAYNDLGLAYEFKKDKKQAIYYYKKALEIKPDYEVAKKNLRIVKNS